MKCQSLAKPQEYSGALKQKRRQCLLDKMEKRAGVQKVRIKRYCIRLPENRFLNKIEYTDMCWVWKESKESRYGLFSTRDRSNLAHRYSYELFVGKIPPNKTIDHLCFNKKCVNPGHLEAVDSRTNTLRSLNAPATINMMKTHCQKGHELSGENLYKHKNHRHCKICRRERNRLWQISNK